MAENPPAGWYPDNNGTTRWWDGDQWTEHQPPPPATEPVRPDEPALAATATAVRAPAEPAPPSRTRADGKADKAYAKAIRPWYKKKRFIIPIALIAFFIVGSALSGGTSPDATDNIPSSKSEGESSTGEDAAEEKSEPDMTAGQRNALRSAENYLSFAPFSRKGLIQQLSSDAGDGYSKKNATFAADHVEVSWKEQAAKAAQNYLDISGFSRQGLIQQLSSDAGDGYTRKQAIYGVDKAGL